MDSAFGCQMTHTKILSAANVLFTFIPERAWRERQGLRFVNSLRSETAVNRDTKSSLFLLKVQLPLCSVCSHLPGVVWGHELQPCTASQGFCWALECPPARRQRCAFRHWTFPLAQEDDHNNSMEKQLFSTIQALHSSHCARMGSLLLTETHNRQRKEGLHTELDVCTNTPDNLLNKFVVYSSDELLG